MKTLLLLVLAMAACDPTAQALCEAQVACGQYADTSACFEDLQARHMAAAICGDEYYALIDCESGLDYECGGLERAAAASCAQEVCEHDACRAGGHDYEAVKCSGAKFNAAGRWSLYLVPETTECFEYTYDYFIAIKSGGAYQIVVDGVNVMSTGSIVTSSEGATAHLMFTSGTAPEIQSADLTLTATPMPDGYSTATITGSGTYSMMAGCTANVTVTGTIVPDERATP